MKQSADLVVYGATPAGIAAACSAAERGMSVLMLEPWMHIGGHLTSGICTTECEHMLAESFRGWMIKFLRLIGRIYGIDTPLHRWEPHRATEAYLMLLDDAGVRYTTNTTITSVKTLQGAIRSCTLDNGDVVEAPFWIDAGYEGDLMALAEVPYKVGRESIEDYGESLAGIRFVDTLEEVENSKGHARRIDEIREMDLKDSDGAWIDGVIPSNGLHTRLGTGDGKVMNYHYRVTVTSASDRVPFPVPIDYNEERYELLSRFFRTAPQTPLRNVLAFLNHPSGHYEPDPVRFTRVTPGQKWELNNLQGSMLSLGYLGGQFDYPDGSPATRRRVIQDHYDHNAGLLHYLSSSSKVPQHIRNEMQGWGLPSDEYTDNDHWPYQPYIRETRRMQGEYIMTQHDVLDEIEKPDCIYRNSHWIDCHHVQRLALDNTHFRNEGRIWKEVITPYAVPYGALLPRPEHCTNLLVPGCISSTHVAFCSLRLESSWMGLGEAAGQAAVLAHEHNTAIQEIPIQALQRRLGIA